MTGSDRASVAALIESCRSGDPRRQTAALVALEEVGGREAVAVVIEALRAADVGVRLAAAAALGRIGVEDPDQAGPALVSALEDAAEIVRSEAAESLGAVGYRRGVDAVRVRLALDASELVRASAAEALGELGDLRAFAELCDALIDVDESVRGYAARSVGIVGGQQALPSLADALRLDQPASVRIEIWAARYRLGDDPALDHFVAEAVNADEHLATIWLNGLEDVLGGGRHDSLIASVKLLASRLDEIRIQHPLLRQHATALRSRLSLLTGGGGTTSSAPDHLTRIDPTQSG